MKVPELLKFVTIIYKFAELMVVKGNNYDVQYDIATNKIHIKFSSDKKDIVSKRVQIFSPKREFPFMFAGTIAIGPAYHTWIHLDERVDFLDWKRGGCIVRILSEGSIEEEIHINTPETKTRVLFIAPHLSTGGCPQYLLKKIQTFKDVLDIYVVEYNFLGSDFVVQRDKIIKILQEGRFWSLGGKDKHELIQIIEKVSPDIVHFEEIPETYNWSNTPIDHDILEKIYTKPDRKYFITETTHSSHSLPQIKQFLPDKFIFCSQYSLKKFSSLDVPAEVWEYPIEEKIRQPREEAMSILGLDPSYIHVLNVGLFTPGKNQGELFEIARRFEKDRVMFHFVGNMAQNFEHYWGPLLPEKPANCVLWGERADVEDFLSACDVFYFSSKFELNPLVIKEALSWKLPVLMYDLETYLHAYKGKKNVYFLNGEIEKNEHLLRNVINALPVELTVAAPRTKIVHIVSFIEDEIEKKSIQAVSQLASPGIEYTIHYNPPTLSIPENREPLFSREEIGKNLKPGHFGCFEAFRKAITEDFSDDFDFLIVCERDCMLEKSKEEIWDLLKKTYEVMSSEDICYFSFGDKVDLDHCVLQSEKVRDLPGNFSFETEKIIGLQFVIFSRKGRDFLKRQFSSRGWHGMDIWLNVVFREENMKMGILSERATTQYEGFSLIDNEFKEFRANDNEKCTVL